MLVMEAAFGIAGRGRGADLLRLSQGRARRPRADLGEPRGRLRAPARRPARRGRERCCAAWSPRVPGTPRRSSSWASCSRSRAAPPRRSSGSIARSPCAPTPPAPRHNRAQALFALGPHRRGARRARAPWWKRKPDLHAAWNLLGSVLAAQGDPRAEQAYRRALALRPDHPETHYNLGVFFLEARAAGRGDRVQPQGAACCAPISSPRTTTSPTRCARAAALEESLVHYARAVRARAAASPTDGRTTARRCARPGASTRRSRRSSAP